MVSINFNIKAMYSEVQGLERHEMLTVIDAYYSYYKILQVCHILHYSSFNINVV